MRQSGALTDVIPSVAAHLARGVAVDALGLPDAPRYVLVLVDGLGWDCLNDEASRAPALASMASRRLTVGVPSTTATSLTSLTTGVPAAAHGVVGFSFRTRPGVVMNTMAWDDPASAPEAVQATPTWFERLRGVAASAAVIPAPHTDSGLTRAFLRGADIVGVKDESDWAARARQVVAVAEGHELCYVYERGLDHVAHLKGWRSPQWRRTLARVDAFVAGLIADLPAGTCLLVTGDHGMVDVPKTHRVFIEDEPALVEGVDLIGGEPRLRHVYTRQPAEVAARWAGFLGQRAEVRLRDDAYEWFGGVPKDDAVRDRIGDVVVAGASDWAVLTWKRPGEVSLMAMHGSLTPGERGVPLCQEVIG